MNVMMLDNYSIRKANIVIYNDCFSLEQCDEIQELQKGRDVILSNDDESFLLNYKHGKSLYSYEKVILDDTIHVKQEEDNQPKDEIEIKVFESTLPNSLEDHLMSYIFDANVKVFGYEIWGMEKDPEILTFKKDDFFGYHENMLWYSEEANDRKLTGYVYLSDHNKSEGGELLFDKSQDISSPLGNYNLRGNLVIFPSFLCYSFNKIKSGFLQVLAFDIIGPKLK